MIKPHGCQLQGLKPPKWNLACWEIQPSIVRLISGIDTHRNHKRTIRQDPTLACCVCVRVAMSLFIIPNTPCIACLPIKGSKCRQTKMRIYQTHGVSGLWIETITTDCTAGVRLIKQFTYSHHAGWGKQFSSWSMIQLSIKNQNPCAKYPPSNHSQPWLWVTSNSFCLLSLFTNQLNEILNVVYLEYHASQYQLKKTVVSTDPCCLLMSVYGCFSK